MSTINISGIPKHKVLQSLYYRSKPLGMGVFHFDSAPLSEAEALEIFNTSDTKYFDYVKGRVLKISLATNEVDARLYNRDIGDDAAEKVVLGLRMLAKQSIRNKPKSPNGLYE